MNIKTISGYIAVLTLSFLLYATKPANALYYSSLPVLMVMFPIIAGHRVKLKFAVKDIILGIIVSAIILLPYSIAFSPFHSPPPLEGGGWGRGNLLYYVIFQLLSVAFPEEFFFRGFLQDSTGRNLKSVLMVSLLFAAAHLPMAVFLGEWISLLSFFPSLVMGWLYMKTNNIIPGTIFHLLANLVYKIT
jgi:membrane protease YdiL (CAAX protease family)